MTPGQALSVRGVAAAQRSRLVVVILICAVAAVAMGSWIADLALNGHILTVVFLAGLLFPVVMWRRPEIGVALFVLVATLIEQLPIDQFPMSGQPALILTDQVPIFESFRGSFGLSGLMVSPLEICLAVALLVWMMKAILQRRLRLSRSYLTMGMAALVAILVVGEVVGLAHGGSFRESVDELRPWIYLVALYVVASQVLDRPEAIRPILWAFVIGSGVKGIQGAVRFLLLRGASPRPESILGHEESLFFGLFLVIVAGLWLFSERSRLRTVATALAPFVLIADLGNNRRAAWLILSAMFLVLGVLAWVRLPGRRRLVGTWATVIALGSLLYLPLFWNSNGGLAQPARAIRSIVAPGSRDNLSDLYRTQEDANLKFNIRLNGPLGAGFGVPIDYALPITNLLSTTPSLAFVPHNGILYVWMRLGVPGMVVFWWLIGAALLTACQLLRSRDGRLALFGAFVACALFAYVLMGSYDLGLSWFRIAVAMGCLLGALDAAARISRASTTVPVPARTPVPVTRQGR